MTVNDYILNEFGIFCANLSRELREDTDMIRDVIRKNLNENGKGKV